jgi:hypothetical protein
VGVREQGPKGRKIRGGWRKLVNKELHNFYRSQNVRFVYIYIIVKVILKCMLGKQFVRVCIGLIWLRSDIGRGLLWT